MDNELVKHRQPDTAQTIEKSADGAKLYTFTREKVEVRSIIAGGVQELDAQAEDFFSRMQNDDDLHR